MINIINIFLTQQFQRNNMWCNGLNPSFNLKVQGLVVFPIVFATNEMDDKKHITFK
jgi:hypothetical protein